MTDAHVTDSVHRRTLAVGLVLSTSLVAFEVNSTTSARPGSDSSIWPDRASYAYSENPGGVARWT